MIFHLVSSLGLNLDLSNNPLFGSSNNCLNFAFVSSDYNGQVISCSTASDGSLSIIVFGGTGPYNYQWENGTVDSLRNNLSAGTYAVTVTDANGEPIDSPNLQIGQAHPGQPQIYEGIGVIQVRDQTNERVQLQDTKSHRQYTVSYADVWDCDTIEWVEETA